MAATITFRLTDEQGGFIDQMIESGDFANQSEVIRAGIRLLQEQQAKSKLNQLRQLVKEGEHLLLEGTRRDSVRHRDVPPQN